jgi:hypothetical protein
VTPVHIRDRQGRSYYVTQELLKLGRAIDNDVVLKDLSISRYHIALQPTEGGLAVFNTGSDSGFYINEQWYLDSAVAQNGDIIRIGQEEFMVDIQAPLQTDDFQFTTPQEASVSRTGSLDVNSRNKNIRKVLLGFVAILMVGLTLLPEDKKVEDTNRKPASLNDSPTQALPNESYSDVDTPRMGPQELTADDLYKRGLRELSNNNQIRAIQYFQQSLVEDPSLTKSRFALGDAEVALKNRVEKMVLDSEKNYKDSRLTLSRAQANHALDLMSEQILGFSFQVQQKQRTPQETNRKQGIIPFEQVLLSVSKTHHAHCF